MLADSSADAGDEELMLAEEFSLVVGDLAYPIYKPKNPPTISAIATIQIFFTLSTNYFFVDFK